MSNAPCSARRPMGMVNIWGEDRAIIDQKNSFHANVNMWITSAASAGRDSGRTTCRHVQNADAMAHCPIHPSEDTGDHISSLDHNGAGEPRAWGNSDSSALHRTSGDRGSRMGTMVVCIVGPRGGFPFPSKGVKFSEGLNRLSQCWVCTIGTCIEMPNQDSLAGKALLPELRNIHGGDSPGHRLGQFGRRNSVRSNKADRWSASDRLDARIGA